MDFIMRNISSSIYLDEHYMLEKLEVQVDGISIIIKKFQLSYTLFLPQAHFCFLCGFEDPFLKGEIMRPSTIMA